MNKSILFILGFFIVININAQYSTPGTGVNWTMDDLVANSNGVVILNSNYEYEILEDLNILTTDTLSFHAELMARVHPEVLITVNGVLFTDMIDMEMVTFTGLDEGEQYFKGFRFEDSEGSILKWMNIQKAGGIKLVESHVEFFECLFSNFNQDQCTGTIDLYQSHPTIFACEFTENAGPAVLSGANGASSPQIMYCYMLGNVSSNTNMPQINLGTSGADSIRIINCSIHGNTDYDQVGGIAITTLAGGEIKCRIEGNNILNNRYGITQYGNNIGSIIRNNVIEDNNTQGSPMLGGSGINFFGNESNQSFVSANKITGNLWGITIQGTAKPNFGEIENEYSPGLNQFFDNGNEGEVYDFYNNTPDDIMAQNNYWGTMDPVSVESHIFHQPDDPTLGFVDYLPLYDIYTGLDEKTNSAPKLITRLFPNPANEFLNIQLTGAGSSCNVQLSDITGKLVFSRECADGQITIPVNDFEDGMYLLKVSRGGSCEKQKVILKK